MTHVLQGRQTKPNRRERGRRCNDAGLGNRKAQGTYMLKNGTKATGAGEHGAQEVRQRHKVKVNGVVYSFLQY